MPQKKSAQKTKKVAKNATKPPITLDDKQYRAYLKELREAFPSLQSDHEAERAGACFMLLFSKELARGTFSYKPDGWGVGKRYVPAGFEHIAERQKN